MRIYKSAFKICLIGLSVGLFLCIISLRGFIFSSGLAFWQDLNWVYTPQLYAKYLWDEYTQTAVIANHLIGMSWLYVFPPEIGERLAFIVLFMIMGVSIFYTTYKLTSNYKEKKFSTLLTSLISTLFFIINPIVTMRLGHWFLLWYYAFLPLLFYFSYQSFKEINFMQKINIFKKAIYLSIILFLMSPSIRIPYYLPIIFLAFFTNFSKPYRVYLKKSLFLIGLTFIIYMFLSLVWLLPPLFGSSAPTNYVVTYEAVNLLSRNSGLLNVMSLKSFWATNWFDEVFTFSSEAALMWSIFLIIIPIIAFSSLLVRKDRITLSMSLFSLIILFLAKGVHPPFKNFYDWLIFKSPILSSFGWQFRGANKWNLLLMFCYSILVGLMVSAVLNKSQKIGGHWRGNLFSKCIPVLLIIPLVSAYPMLTGDINGKMKPYQIPEEYIELDHWLEQQGTQFKILMYPSPPEWGVSKPVPPKSDYLRFVESKLLSDKNFNIGRALSVLNIKYVIVRKDVLRSDEISLIIGSLMNQKDLQLIRTFGYLTVFENMEYGNQFSLPSYNIFLKGLDSLMFLATIDSLNFTTSSLLFLDQSVHNVSHEYVSNCNFLISNEDIKNASLFFPDGGYILPTFPSTDHHDPSRFWSKAMTSDPLHGEWHPYLDKMNIENWDFDYGKGLVFTWVSSTLSKQISPKKSDLLAEYDFENNLSGWNINTPNIQKIFLDRKCYFHGSSSSLLVRLNSSTSGWKIISSPLINIDYRSQYRWEFYVKGEQSHKVHVKIIEYNKNKEIISTRYIERIGDGNFKWRKVYFNFVPDSQDIQYMQLQIWHGHETPKPLPNEIWIDNVKIYNLSRYLKPNTLDIPFIVKKNGDYELFVRYFKNEKGGKINIYLDENLIKTIETKDQFNEFTWKYLGKLNLKKGKHVIKIDNINGFNAVNIFYLVSPEKYREMENKTYDIIKDKRIIYVFEGENDFYSKDTQVLDIGGKASDGNIVSLQPNSKIWRDIYILKNSTYRIAVRENGSIKIKIGNQSLDFNSTKLDYKYATVYLTRGEYKIELTPREQKPIKWSFNHSEDLEEWKNVTTETDIYNLRLDNGSLKATLYNSTWGWKTINSPFITVNQSMEYTWKFKIKGKNSHAVHAKIAEYTKDRKIITSTRLGSVGDGSFDWKNLSFNFKPTSKDTYYMQLQIWHGHETPKPLPNEIWIDDIEVYGYYPSTIDVLWIFSTINEPNEKIENIFESEKSAELLNYEKVDPTKYVIKIKATKPFMLSFAESYDPLWEARVYKEGKLLEKVESIPLYSVINGFWINETGNLSIEIRYTPQDWFEIGLVISTMTFIGCIGYLVYDWKNRWRCRDIVESLRQRKYRRYYRSSLSAFGREKLDINLYRKESRLYLSTLPREIRVPLRELLNSLRLHWRMHFPYVFVSTLIVVSHLLFKSSILLISLAYISIIPVFIIFRFNGRIPVYYGILLFVITGILKFYRDNSMVDGLNNLIGQIATYATLLVIVGVICLIIEYSGRYIRINWEKLKHPR